MLLLIAFTTFFLCLTVSNAHPLCYDGSYPVSQPSLTYCEEYKALSCCTLGRQNDVVSQYVTNHGSFFSGSFNLLDKTSWNACDVELIKIACLFCSPYEAHVFERDPNKPLLCNATYCESTFKTSCASKPLTCSNVGLASLDPWCHPIVSPPLPTSVAGLAPVFGNVTIDSPIEIRWTNADPVGAYVASQKGFIYRVFPVQNGGYSKSVFLDVSSQTNTQGELGFLGFIFHPKYSENCYMFVYYTQYLNNKNTNVIGRVHVPNCQNVNNAVANATTQRNHIVIEKTTTNHNGGSMDFDSDENLLVAIGDGGTQNDGSNNGQNTQNLFGTVIRIKPATPSNPLSCSTELGTNYTIPSSNPFFFDTTKGLAEIYAYGLRNPWNCKMIQPGNRLYCGDVGQQEREEITVAGLGDNLGWSLAEGDGAFNQASPAEYSALYNSPNYRRPLADYRHLGSYSLNPRTVPNIFGYAIIYGGPYNGRFLGPKYRTNFHIFADYNEFKIAGMWLDEGPSPKPPSGELLIVESPPISRIRYGPDDEPYFVAYYGPGVPSPIFKFSSDAKMSICGNFRCEQSESCTSCPVDCSGVLTGPNSKKWCCANGACEYGPCNVDCSARLIGSRLNNNVCEPNESCLTTNDCPSRKTTGNNENDFCCYGSNDGPVCSSQVNGVLVMNSPYCKTLNDPCGRGNSNGRGFGWGGW